MSFSLKSKNEEMGSIILLHGFGADANNLKFMAEIWQELHPNWNFLGIDGINALDDGYSWFDLEASNWQDGMIEAENYLSNMFKDYTKKIIFAGFSQGAFLSAHMGLYSNLNSSGVICFSGGIIPFEKKAKNTPIYLIHGTQDCVIVPAWYEKSIEFAQNNKLNVIGKMIENMDHEINEESFDYATQKLDQIIKNVPDVGFEPTTP